MTESTIIAIVGIIAISLMGAFAVYRVSGDARETAKEFGKLAIRNTISNSDISTVIEEGLQRLPKPLLDSINSLVDVFNPTTESTISTLDNDTQLWIKNMTDGDLTTGAVIEPTTKE